MVIYTGTKNDDNVVVLVVCRLVATSPTAATWQVGIRGSVSFASCGSRYSSGSGDGGQWSCLVAVCGCGHPFVVGGLWYWWWTVAWWRLVVVDHCRRPLYSHLVVALLASTPVAKMGAPWVLL